MKDILSQRKEAADAMVREAVCDAAISLLRDQGLGGVTMDAVAEATGVAKGTVYNYFKNKEELLVAVHGRVVQPLVKELDEIFASEEPSAAVVVQKLCDTIWHHVDEKRSTMFILHECKSLESSRLHYEGEFIEALSQVIQRGVDREELREQDARTSAWFILGMLAQGCKQPLACPELCPPVGSILETMKQFIMGGIGRRPTD